MVPRAPAFKVNAAKYNAGFTPLVAIFRLCAFVFRPLGIPTSWPELRAFRASHYFSDHWQHRSSVSQQRRRRAAHYAHREPHHRTLTLTRFLICCCACALLRLSLLQSTTFLPPLYSTNQLVSLYYHHIGSQEQIQDLRSVSASRYGILPSPAPRVSCW